MMLNNNEGMKNPSFQYPQLVIKPDLESKSMSTEPTREKIPFWQQMADNPFLLLFIGVVMPTVFYILWGIMEVATIPVAP